ncbi:MAG: right-handed parallel beta-helix repeat-containing protein [Acidimicrobiales bacterium]
MPNAPARYARTTCRRLLAAIGATLVLAACSTFVEEPVIPEGEVGAGSQLVGCERAAERVVVSVSSHLDPSCTYREGFDITASDVVLDCRGARVEDLDGTRGIGIHVTAPAHVSLRHVTIRNCLVRGFLNNIRVSREGFKQLPRGEEYEDGFEDILIEHNHLYSSRGSGLFVNGYVTGVTVRDMDIAGSGGVGIYLEAGSMGSRVVGNHIHHNGYAGTGPEGATFDLGGGVVVRYLSTGREGLAIDGSRRNRILDNRFDNNANGAMLVYKNCGEYVHLRPEQWWTRPYGADGNLIAGNLIRNEKYGVWVGSRMSENQAVLDCSDPAYVAESGLRIHEDQANANVVRDNDLRDVRWGIRVEDDATHIFGNHFSGTTASGAAVMIGTQYRTTHQQRPVRATRIVDNRVDIAGLAHPYLWIHGHEATEFRRNRSGATTASLERGTQPPRDPFLMVVRFL